MRKLITTGLVLTTLIVAGCGSNNTTPNANPNTPPNQEAKAPSKSQIAYDKFVGIPMGASYEQVKSELGVDGSLTHESAIGDLKSQSYKFDIDSAHMSMMFQNGELTSKSIMGLSFLNPSGPKITLDQFNKIQTGMTYDQVKEILGSEGHLSTQTALMGHTSSLFTWINTGGSNVVITFGSEGTVDSKSQFGLK